MGGSAGEEAHCDCELETEVLDAEQENDVDEGDRPD